MTSTDELRVRFVTQDASIRVVDTPFAVPLTLARYGLSQIVNHLLGRGKTERCSLVVTDFSPCRPSDSV